MKKIYYSIFVTLFLVIPSKRSFAQTACILVNKLSINTGYNHIANSLLTHNQPDTFWRITAISAASASYYPAMPTLPYFANTVVGIWPTRTTTSEWISFLPDGYYIEKPPNPLDSLWTEFSRDFKLCEDDTILFNMDLTNDNFCKKVMVDGVLVPPALPFTQPSSLASSHYLTWTTIAPFKLALSAGIHRITFRIHQFPVGTAAGNPVGFSVKGGISSTRSINSIVGYSSELDCSCGCKISTVKVTPKDTSACDSISFSLLAAGALNYTWSPSSGLDNPNIPNPNVSINKSSTYIVKGVDTSGCVGYDTVIVIINPNPKILATPSDTTSCVDAILQLNASGADTYAWTPLTDLDNPSVYNPKFRSKSIGLKSISVKGIDKNGCIGYDTIKIKVNPNPVINAIPDTSLTCVGATILLSGSGGVKYSWSPEIGLSNPLIGNPKLKVQANIGKYILTGVDANGCTGKDSISIILKSGSKVTARPSDTSGCVGTEIQLNATGAVSYQWQPPSGLDKDNIANPKLIISGVVRYVVTGTDTSGCTDTDTLTVKGFTLPKVQATSDNTIADCNEKTVLLNATGAETYEWYPAIYCDNSNAASTNVRPPATRVFTVKGVDKNGCVGEDTITVFYEGKSSIRVPNAFTPNNDGINDKIIPIIVCDFTLTEFVIYNRWGEQVFFSQSISNPWNGIFNGKPCDMGVYYYLIKGKTSTDEEVMFKGDITLIR